MKSSSKFIKLILLDIMGVIIIPSICFLVSHTFFLVKPQSPQNHGGAFIYLVGYIFFSSAFILPLQLILSVAFVYIPFQKSLLKTLPIGLWMTILFLIQLPVINAKTEYRIFNSYVSAVLFLVISIFYVLLYEKAVEKDSE